MKEKDIVWCDVNNNKYTLKEIDDRYLLNILRFISRGGGYKDFLDEGKIRKLYNEANRRKIKHNLKLVDLISAYYEKVYYESIYDD